MTRQDTASTFHFLSPDRGARATLTLMFITLIGYRGTGKTTVAQRLALRLGCQWRDADVEIELRAGKSIAAIFADEGEPVFRDLEAELIAELAARPRLVLAAGGGAVLRERTRRRLAAAGPVVWLTASAETIQARISADDTTAGRRPNLTAAGGIAEIRRLLAEREPVYRQCASLAVDTEGKSPAAVAEEILAQLHLPPGGDATA